MLPLGLLLVIAAGVAGVAVAMDNTDPTTIAAFGQSYGMTTTGVFLVGAVVGIVLMAGFALMVAGALGRRDRRRVTRTRVRDAHAENETLAEENARLRAQVVDSDPYPTDTPTRTTGKHTV